MPLPLSPSQQRVFAEVVRYFQEQRRSPSIAEIAQRCDWSLNYITLVLRALEKKGWLRRTVGEHRSIELLP